MTGSTTKLGYWMEAWRGLDCLGFAGAIRPATIARKAQAYAADGADRIYIRTTGERPYPTAAEYTPGRGWGRPRDRKLGLALGVPCDHPGAVCQGFGLDACVCSACGVPVRSGRPGEDDGFGYVAGWVAKDPA